MAAMPSFKINGNETSGMKRHVVQLLGSKALPKERGEEFHVSYFILFR